MEYTADDRDIRVEYHHLGENRFAVRAGEDERRVHVVSWQPPNLVFEDGAHRQSSRVTFEGDRSAAALFGTLRACHEEANVLVAEVIEKNMRRSVSPYGPAKAPSLTSLFDSFERELSSVIGRDTEGTAPLPAYLLKSAEVVTRTAPESSTCVAQ